MRHETLVLQVRSIDECFRIDRTFPPSEETQDNHNNLNEIIIYRLFSLNDVNSSVNK